MFGTPIAKQSRLVPRLPYDEIVTKLYQLCGEKTLLTIKRVTGFLTLAALGVLGNLDTAVAQNLVATPSPVNFNVQTGGTAPSQNVNITLNGASVTVQSVSASVNTPQNWLLPSVGSSSVFVSVNAAGLAAGTYTGSVTAVTNSGTINFPVN